MPSSVAQRRRPARRGRGGPPAPGAQIWAPAHSPVAWACCSWRPSRPVVPTLRSEVAPAVDRQL